LLETIFRMLSPDEALDSHCRSLCNT
jgi:hypothetical protein